MTDDSASFVVAAAVASATQSDAQLRPISRFVITDPHSPPSSSSVHWERPADPPRGSGGARKGGVIAGCACPNLIGGVWRRPNSHPNPPIGQRRREVANSVIGARVSEKTIEIPRGRAEVRRGCAAPSPTQVLREPFSPVLRYRRIALSSTAAVRSARWTVSLVVSTGRPGSRNHCRPSRAGLSPSAAVRAVGRDRSFSSRRLVGQPTAARRAPMVIYFVDAI